MVATRDCYSLDSQVSILLEISECFERTYLELNGYQLEMVFLILPSSSLIDAASARQCVHEDYHEA